MNILLAILALVLPPVHKPLAAPPVYPKHTVVPLAVVPTTQPALLLASLTARSNHVDLDPFTTYTVNPAITFNDRHHLTIDGHGATVQADPAMPQNGTQFSTLIFVDCSDITLRNIHFDGQRQNRPGPWGDASQTVYLIRCRDVTVADCTFKDDICDGVYGWAGGGQVQSGEECRDIKVLRCVFDNPGRNGISFTAAAHVVIDGCTFRHIRSGLNAGPNAGVDIEPNPGNPQGLTHDITISRCVAWDCVFGLEACQPMGCYNIVFADNLVANCDYGILTEHYGTAVHGNTVVGGAIYADNCDACRLFDNTVIGTEPSCCIYIDNNHIGNPTGHWVYGNKVHLVAGNTAPPNVVLSNNP
jgi:hypothetical protein